jgi:glycosyltransferase involved in cell wall biosynthesis
VRELALALADCGSAHEIVSFVNREASGAGGFWGEVGRVVSLPASPRSRGAWAWLETVAVPVAAARTRVDVLHSPANLGPLAGPFARVLTLHDVLFRTHPELLTSAMRLGTELLLPAAVRRAHQLITVSRAARDDIVRLLGVQPERVAVVPNGWTPPAEAGDAARARRRLGTGDRPLVLSVASDLPHKDLPLTLDALARISADERPVLVLAGHGTDTGTLPRVAHRLGIEDHVRLLGAVDRETLEDLYSAAALLVMPTRAEGFGLPVLDALGRGLPVACSDLPVLREIAGDLAYWFQPGDAPSAASAVMRALRAEGHGEALRRARRAQAEQFSWRAAAEATAELYVRAHRRR